MEFITKGEAINCIRIIKDKDSGKETQVTVASFNAGVDRVPPHVAAVLLIDEVKELVSWLEDRKKLQSKLAKQTIEHTILESLPHLLRQATQALNDMDQLDLMLFRSISERLKELSEALDNTSRFTAPHEIGLTQMQNSEEQKERLDTIKKDIEKKE